MAQEKIGNGLLTVVVLSTRSTGTGSASAKVLGIGVESPPSGRESVDKIPKLQSLVRQVQDMKWHPEILSHQQRKVLQRLRPFLQDSKFYLGGGTAIALRLGHRYSVDFDWFTSQRISDPLRLAKSIADHGLPFKTSQIDRGTLSGSVFNVRISFFEYRYPLLRPSTFWSGFDCFIASLDDLYCMKLSAIAQRGLKKDFLDIHALNLKHEPLKKMLRFYQKKYGLRDIGPVIYGLAYFDAADKERMPRMRWKTKWTDVKKILHRQTQRLA